VNISRQGRTKHWRKAGRVSETRTRENRTQGALLASHSAERRGSQWGKRKKTKKKRHSGRRLGQKPNEGTLETLGTKKKNKKKLGDCLEMEGTSNERAHGSPGAGGLT